MNYEKLYYLLFHAITNAIYAHQQKDYLAAIQILMAAQKDAEEYFIEHNSES